MPDIAYLKIPTVVVVWPFEGDWGKEGGGSAEKEDAIS